MVPMSLPYDTLCHVLTCGTALRDAPEGNEARLLQRLHDAILALGDPDVVEGRIQFHTYVVKEAA